MKTQQINNQVSKDLKVIQSQHYPKNIQIKLFSLYLNLLNKEEFLINHL